jgi:OmcA/MtrC family decaheme c-type cytochrome
MQTRTSFMALVFALAVLLIGTSAVFAQEPCPCPDVQPESCIVCHSGAGADHQALYNRYTDASAFTVTIDSVVSVPDVDPTKFDTTMTFTVKENGAPYIDVAGLPTLKQKTFYTVRYDSATQQFIDSKSFPAATATPTGTPGQYTVTATGLDFAPEASNAEVYMYIAKDQLMVESVGRGHYALYDNMINVGKTFGDADSYVSPANVSACEKCHGKPYAKHGYRMAKVSGLADFAACKACHYDNRVGDHQDWQIMVDNPKRYAEIFAGGAKTDEEITKYAYTANIMNDVHMSHAMEFPYPQSMANCATCHEGKLDMILTDANFKLETCKSCHPVTGPAEGTEANRAPALETVMPHSISMGTCNGCHTTGGIAPVFSKIHTGYNPMIYADTAGTKYSDIFTVSIDDASFTDNILTIKFSATKNADITTFKASDIIPTVMVGLYGYDTKDFIVSPHSQDADRNRLLEFQINGTTTNPRFTVISAPDSGSGGKATWEVTADLSMWADMIGNGTVKRAEIAVMPLLAHVVGEIDSHENGEHDDTAYALNAPSRTFNLVADAFDDNFYKPIVKVTDGCNNCHDALATTFHSPDRGGNIVVCRLCHVPTSGASHLEMQSRSIDSYVHAIHAFQAFNIGDVNFLDPVAAMRYDLQIEHTYPNFTIQNCESCHNEGTFEVPDQSKSLPGLLSGSATLQGWDRNIGTVPAYVTGPASRACGSCHRASLINEDDAGKLIAFNQHTKQGGYLIEGGDDSASVLDKVIDYIMGLFR